MVGPDGRLSCFLEKAVKANTPVFFIFPAQWVGETSPGTTSLAPSVVSDKNFFQDSVWKFPRHLDPLRLGKLFCWEPL